MFFGHLLEFGLLDRLDVAYYDSKIRKMHFWGLRSEVGVCGLRSGVSSSLVTSDVNEVMSLCEC